MDISKHIFGGCDISWKTIRNMARENEIILDKKQ